MRAALVVAAREISERKRIFVAAAVAGLLPFLAPLFPDLAPGDVPQARAILATVFALSFGIGTAAVLGSTVLVRDLVERRAGFYFARPLPSLAIWGGKILAALLLAAGAGLLSSIPAWIASPGVPMLPGAGPGSLSTLLATFSVAGVVFGGLLFVVALLHAVTLAVRSRSPWLVIDVVLLVVCSLVVGRSAASLLREGLPIAYVGLAGWGLPALLLALLVAGALSVSAGRTDLRRAHGVQSLALWGAVVPLTITAALWTLWLVSPTPGDLVAIRRVTAARSGDWLGVAGPARHRGKTARSFLWNRRTGAFVRLSGNAGRGTLPEFSPDGRTAIWAVLESTRPEEWQVWRADLTAAVPRPRALNVVARSYPWIRFSPSGRRIAVRIGDSLSVLELESERTVAAVRSPGPALDFFFADEETVRLFPAYRRRGDPSPLLLVDFRIPEKKLGPSRKIPAESEEALGLRTLVRSRLGAPGTLLVNDGSLFAVDPATGERRQLLPKPR